MKPDDSNTLDYLKNGHHKKWSTSTTKNYLRNKTSKFNPIS